MAADLADHAEGVPLLRFHLYQPSGIEGCSDEAAGGTDAAEAVPGLRHHVLRSRDSERESVRFRRIRANQFLSSVNTASVSNPNPSRDGTHASRWYLRLISVRTISPSAIAKLFPSDSTRRSAFSRSAHRCLPDLSMDCNGRRVLQQKGRYRYQALGSSGRRGCA